MTHPTPTVPAPPLQLAALLMRRAAWVGLAVLLLGLAGGLVRMGHDMEDEATAAFNLATRIGVVARLAPLSDAQALQALRTLPPSSGTGHLSLSVTVARGAALLGTAAQAEAAPAQARGASAALWHALLSLHRSLAGDSTDTAASVVTWALPRADGTAWQVQLRASPEAERAEALHSLLFLLLMLLLCVGGLLLAMRWNLKRALAPLGQLLHAISRIEDKDDSAVRALPPMPVHELEAVSRALRHLAAALRAAEHQRRTLGQRVITLQEDERARLARELHDEFGQHLTALRVDAAWLQRHLAQAGGNNTAAQDVVAAVAGHVRHIQQLLRSLLQRLRPAGLGHDGQHAEGSANDEEAFTLGRLQGLLAALVESWDARPSAAFRVQLRLGPHDDAGQPLSPALGLAVFRITQEALTNVARHAQASRVEVQLRACADGLHWQVQDDGLGLANPARALLHGSGLGGIQERVWAWGADLILRPASPGVPRPGLLLQARFSDPTAALAREHAA